jgi:hypothetical protein
MLREITRCSEPLLRLGFRLRPRIIDQLETSGYSNATNGKTITPANAGRASRDVSDITGPVQLRSALVTLL